MKRNLLLSLSLIAIFSSCIPLVKEDNPQPNNNNTTTGTTTTPTTSSTASWQSYNVVDAKTLVRGIHSVTGEMFFLTDNQFFRVDNNDKIIEKRDLPNDRQLYGSPVLSDNSFLRISQGTDNKQVIEFHLTHSPSVVHKIVTSSLVDAVQKESFQIDVFGRTPGCFSSDGSKYFLPGVVYPSYKSTLMILNIKFTPDAKNFESITLAKRIELSNLSTDGKIETCRYINGFLYLATKEGGFRISDDGQVTHLFKHWTYDFFEKDGKLYTTGFNSTDFYTSSDNGVSWRKYGNGNLKYVEKVGTKLLNQTQRGLQFDMIDDALLNTVPMKYNSEFPSIPDTYFSFGFMKNQYFINVGSRIYTAKELKAK